LRKPNVACRQAHFAKKKRKLFFYFFECIFADNALWTTPIIGQFFEGRSGLNSNIRIADLGIIDVATRLTLPFFGHSSISFR